MLKLESPVEVFRLIVTKLEHIARIQRGNIMIGFRAEKSNESVNHALVTTNVDGSTSISFDFTHFSIHPLIE